MPLEGVLATRWGLSRRPFATAWAAQAARAEGTWLVLVTANAHRHRHHPTRRLARGGLTGFVVSLCTARLLRLPLAPLSASPPRTHRRRGRNSRSNGNRRRRGRSSRCSHLLLGLLNLGLGGDGHDATNWRRRFGLGSRGGGLVVIVAFVVLLVIIVALLGVVDLVFGSAVGVLVRIVSVDVGAGETGRLRLVLELSSGEAIPSMCQYTNIC